MNAFLLWALLISNLVIILAVRSVIVRLDASSRLDGTVRGMIKEVQDAKDNLPPQDN